MNPEKKRETEKPQKVTKEEARAKKIEKIKARYFDHELTPLQQAIKEKVTTKEKLNTINKLIRSNPPLLFQLGKGGFNPLHTVATADISDDESQQIAELLLSHCKFQKGDEGLNKFINSTSSDRTTALEAASRKGKLKLVKLLIASSVKVNEPGKNYSTPLCSAIRNKHNNVVMELIRSGADTRLCSGEDNAKDRPMSVAVKAGNTEAIKLLAENGAFNYPTRFKVQAEAFQEELNSLLCLASKLGNIEAMKLFIETGAQVNACDKNGKSPLCLASELRDTEAMRFLIDQGAQVNAYDKNGDSPLCLASNLRNIDAMKLLIDKGAQVNKPNGKGNLPLCLAVSKKKRKKMKKIKMQTQP